MTGGGFSERRARCQHFMGFSFDYKYEIWQKCGPYVSFIIIMTVQSEGEYLLHTNTWKGFPTLTCEALDFSVE